MKYKIFVSGVQKELKEERIAVKNFIESDYLFKDHFKVFLFEKDNPSRGKSSEKAYLDEVKNTDIYIGILGYKYGFSESGSLSPTETEFKKAESLSKEIFIYIKGENSKNDLIREAGVQKMIKEIQNPKKGFCYKRFSSIDELKSCLYESLISFLREKGKVGLSNFDRRICEGAKLADIDEDKIEWFLRTAKQRRNLVIDPGLSVADKLIHLNLICDGKITNAAIMLFGKNPHKYFLQSEIKCLQFFGVEVEKPFESFKIFSDNLFEQVDKALAFVLDSIKKPLFQREDSAQAGRDYEIPVFAIQEAIVNAVAHRNYNTASGVQVMVFSDRIEIVNSGGLPSGLSVEDLRKPHQSYPGNPLIAHVFFFADYIQKSGTGTVEMIKQCKQKGVPEPYFEIKRNVEFKTIIPRDQLTQKVLEMAGLNDRQRAAIKYIKEKGKITNREYRKISGLSDEGVRKDINFMISKKIIEPKGKGRSVSYRLSNGG
ncbi:MAG: hypothetical protein A2231_05385 [Candidatus Firestonebacteria bacterium RIFOXYA2_FULL_40_8]|nr:MAG: hypothetical protein A2231_05385 [Candidatus Firestonebacteria bacterium RIFOXYA2_FULL_40_8]